jgi:integrase
MTRKLGRLKASQIDTLGPGRHHDGGGLYLVVGKGAARSWIFRYFRDGKSHDHGLGPTHVVGLALARQRALECKLALYGGKHPVETRQAERAERVLATVKAVTFEQAAERYIAAKAPEWRDRRQAGQWRQSLTDYVFPVIGKLPVMAIETSHVTRVLEPIWLAKTETASRIRGRIEAILAWATTLKYRTGPNPAVWRGHLENILSAPDKVKRVEHHLALDYREIGTFMAALRQQDAIPARALEFLILTASRSEEVRGAQWGEIDLAERFWTVPGDRMKAGKAHRVPLSDAAMQLLEAMPQVGEFVFPGRDGPIGPMAMRRVLESIRDTVSVHGFRSTFREWSTKTSYSREVAEMALAHTVKGKTEEAYWRTDHFEERQAMMQDWANRCAGGAAVVPLPTRVVS